MARQSPSVDGSFGGIRAAAKSPSQLDTPLVAYFLIDVNKLVAESPLQQKVQVSCKIIWYKY